MERAARDGTFPRVPIVVAFVAAAGIALVAGAARALTRSGMAAAVVVGTAILAAQGLAGGAVLLAFFVSSSLVGRLAGRPTALDAKGETRDWAQVLANGGAAALGALAGGPTHGLLLQAAALAAAGADTWATAWGSGSRTPPRFVLNGRVVPPGTNGGISFRGTVGAVGGAAVVALVLAAAPALGGPPVPAGIAAQVAGLGVLGMLLDSLLGATVQGRFRCPRCDRPSERRRHRCGTPTDPVGGLPWIGNDLVNALATFGTLGLAWLRLPS